MTKNNYSKGGIQSLVVVIIALLVLLAAGLYFNNSRGGLSGGGGELSAGEIKQRVEDYLERNMEGFDYSVGAVVEENGLYQVVITIAGEEYVSYVSRNGKLLFPQALDLSFSLADQEGSEADIPVEIAKRDRPEVKLFVMSYCPYGLQAQKALLPVWELLKDKADIGIYFVDYLMHGKQELDENLLQYCLEKEQPDKIISYLNCFTLEGDSAKCLSQAGADSAKASTCVATTDEQFGLTATFNSDTSAYPAFNIHTAFNSQYGVTGSPTLVINDGIIEPSDRSPEAFKQAICQAFNVLPGECEQTLSMAVASPGIGGGTGASSSGGCE